MEKDGNKLSVWIDFQKAFDKVWRDGLQLLLKLRRCNISGNMFKWIKSYTHNRRDRVVIDNNRSKKILLRHGVPQGGFLSPTRPTHFHRFTKAVATQCNQHILVHRRAKIQPYQLISKLQSLQQDGVNRRRHSWLPIKQSWDRLWSMPLLYGRLLHPRPALTNCKSCRTQHWELPQDEHKTQTYNTCMTKHSHFPYTSTYSSTHHNTNKKTQHPSHPLHKHTTYFNTPRLKKTHDF